TDWPARTPNLPALMDEMNAALVAIPGVDVNFSQPIRDNVNENMAGQYGQVALKIFSPNMDDLAQAAVEAKGALATVQGVADLGIVKSGEAPQIQVKPKREMLGRFGLTMYEVQSFLATALGGRVVADIWDGERVFDVVLRLPGET